MSDPSAPATGEGEATLVGEVTTEVIPAPLPTSEDQIQVGQSIPGSPPKGFPTGPGVDMYGNKLTYGTGPNDIPPECEPGYVHPDA
jgi:hypothetical protein